jgi:NAD(P)-dependent dehydrogenase (short-subunit alcohol dehydrogenase family)
MTTSPATTPLSGRTALVAGATRGAGRAIAVELARAGAHVYATGRSSRAGRSEIGRPETIEDTGDLVAGVGSGTAVPVDHEDPDAVAALVRRIGDERGALDVLVNDMFGGDRYARGTSRCGSTTSPAADGCWRWVSGPTWSPPTMPCR